MTAHLLIIFACAVFLLVQVAQRTRDTQAFVNVLRKYDDAHEFSEYIDRCAFFVPQTDTGGRSQKVLMRCGGAAIGIEVVSPPRPGTEEEKYSWAFGFVRLTMQYGGRYIQSLESGMEFYTHGWPNNFNEFARQLVGTEDTDAHPQILTNAMRFLRHVTNTIRRTCLIRDDADWDALFQKNF